MTPNKSPGWLIEKGSAWIRVFISKTSGFKLIWESHVHLIRKFILGCQGCTSGS